MFLNAQSKIYRITEETNHTDIHLYFQLNEPQFKDAQKGEGIDEWEG